LFVVGVCGLGSRYGCVGLLGSSCVIFGRHFVCVVKQWKLSVVEDEGRLLAYLMHWSFRKFLFIGLVDGWNGIEQLFGIRVCGSCCKDVI